MEIFGWIEPQRYLWGMLIMDVVIGVVSLVPILIAALALGGFSFILPWLIAVPLVMFSVGWWRGRSFGNLWVKALALCAPALLGFAWLQQADTKAGYLGLVMITAGWTVLPTAGGIKIRRRQAG
jgi:hypothetical protein